MTHLLITAKHWARKEITFICDSTEFLKCHWGRRNTGLHFIYLSMSTYKMTKHLLSSLLQPTTKFYIPVSISQNPWITKIIFVFLWCSVLASSEFCLFQNLFGEKAAAYPWVPQDLLSKPVFQMGCSHFLLNGKRFSTQDFKNMCRVYFKEVFLLCICPHPVFSLFVWF